MLFIKILVFILVVVIGYDLVMLVLLFDRGSDVSKEVTPFEQVVGNPQMRILVAGDSTALGTGSQDPNDSIAGRLGALFPQSSIKNIGINGLTTGGLREKLEALPESEHHDLILLQTGGNDILRFVSLGSIRRELMNVLGEAKKRGEKVILMSTGNVGLAPAFGPVLERMYTFRTRQVRALFMDIAKQENIPYVDLFEERTTDRFAQDPGRFYARDGLHPSGEGYGLWFENLTAVLEREGLVK